MKVSKKELHLLIGVLAVLIGVLYYTFPYSSQKEDLEAARQNRSNAKTEYDKVMAEIKTLDSRKEQVKELTASNVTKATPYYPEIIQEKLIVDINDILTKTGLKGDIVFNSFSVGEVEYLKPDIEYFDANTFEKEKVGIDAGKSIDTSNKTEELNKDSKEKKEKTSATCEQLKVTVNYKGNYQQLKAFQQELENRNRMIVSTGLTGTSVNGELSGTISFEYYGLTKLGDADKDYSNWPYNNTYGKDLFSGDAAINAYINSVDNNQNGENKYDFIGRLKGPSSIYPSLTFGKANDKYGTSYIYNTSKNDITLNVTLTEKDGKYYYKYESGSNVYPSTNSGNGIEFTPIGNEIKIMIASEVRNDSSDKAKVNVKVINNTNKDVSVDVTSDDAASPRVELTSEGGKVYKK